MSELEKSDTEFIEKSKSSLKKALEAQDTSRKDYHIRETLQWLVMSEENGQHETD